MRDFRMSKKSFTALMLAIIAVLTVSFISPAFASAAETASAEDAGFFVELKDNITEAVDDLKTDINNVLIKNDNYKHITDGLLITIEITLAALVIRRRTEYRRRWDRASGRRKCSSPVRSPYGALRSGRQTPNRGSSGQPRYRHR